MNKTPSVIMSRFGRQILIAKKNSPHIFFGLGLAGSIVSTVLACRATLKLSETLDKVQKDIEIMKPPINRLESENLFVLEPNTIEHIDTAYIYAKASLRIVRLYTPSIVVGVASIGMLTGSHVQLVRRNTALMAAYAAVQKAYDEYRERVRQELGADKELDIYHAAKTELVKGADGQKTEVKVADPNKYSPYAKFFDEYSDKWEKDPELNRIYIQCQQNYLNHRLNAYGHVFLNEAYDALGIPRSRAGAVVGWLRQGDGDGYIDFGIFEAFNTQFVNGSERSILLDFNVDGVIYDKI